MKLSPFGANNTSSPNLPSIILVNRALTASIVHKLPGARPLGLEMAAICFGLIHLKTTSVSGKFFTKGGIVLAGLGMSAGVIGDGLASPSAKRQNWPEKSEKKISLPSKWAEAAGPSLIGVHSKEFFGRGVVTPGPWGAAIGGAADLKKKNQINPPITRAPAMTIKII